MSHPQPQRFLVEADLASRLWELARGRSRTLVGIAGIPGSGKSTLAADLQPLLDRLAGRAGATVIVPQDGFHRTNAEIARLGLSAIKGCPESFDPVPFLAKLREIQRAEAPVRMPVYSRELHEPVPDAVEVRPEAPIVLVEGIYLFLDRGPWREIAALFDLRVFVEVDRATAEARVVARHERGGLGPREAAAKYARNDRPNSDLVAPGARFADLVFESRGFRGAAPFSPSPPSAR